MIKGLIPTLAEGGKIKIGGLGPERTSKKGNTYRLPQKYDHFVVTKTTRDGSGDLEIDREIMGVLPKDRDGLTRSIPIVLHSDRIEDVFPTSYAWYSGRKLTCRGDGERATRWEFDDKGARKAETSEIACPCPMLGAEGGCKPHGTLHCSIVAPSTAVAGAVHKWRTTSIISIQRMIGSLEQIISLCGTLRGVPLWLRLEPITVSPLGAPSSTVYCCHVELRAKDILAVQSKALKMAEMRRALGGDSNANYRLLVSPPGGDQETEEEQAEVAAEFHGEAVVKEEMSAPKPTSRLKAAIGIPAAEGAAEAPPLPTDKPGVKIATGKIDDMKIKEGKNAKGKPWVRYGIRIGDEWYGTFSKTIGAEIEKYYDAGNGVKISYTEEENNGKVYLTVDGIEALAAEASEEVV